MRSPLSEWGLASCPPYRPLLIKPTPPFFPPLCLPKGHFPFFLSYRRRSPSAKEEWVSFWNNRTISFISLLFSEHPPLLPPFSLLGKEGLFLVLIPAEEEGFSLFFSPPRRRNRPLSGLSAFFFLPPPFFQWLFPPPFQIWIFFY